MKLGDLKTSGRLKLLLIGESGSGKTSFLAGMPKPWIADFDGKVVSGAEFLRKHKPAQLAHVEYEDYASMKGAPILPANKVNSDLGKFKTQVPFPYETVGLDSLTTFSDHSMEYLIKANPGVVKRMATQGVQLPVLQDYQMARIWFKQFIGAMLALPCNVVMTAHIQTEKDEVTGRIIRSPMMAGKLAQELPIYFGEVWRSYRDDKGQHWAQTQSDSYFTCRSQIPGLPNPVKLDWDEINKYLV